MKSNHKIYFILMSFFITTFARADYLPWSEIEKRFKSSGLNTKALGHVKCFFDKHESTVFQKKQSYNPGTENRCIGDSEITLDSKRIFSVIDYSAPSDERRMYLVDRQTGAITTMAVAHGRYNASMINTHLSLNKNSVKTAKYFSNDPGSNAPSSGFFIAGQEYVGKFGRSLVVHGLEKGINDNACERTVVIHKHTLVTNSQAFVLSSGCAMISKNYIDTVINLLEGRTEANGAEVSGGVVFIYGPREAGWKAGSCDGSFNI